MMYKIIKPAGIFWARDMLKYQQEQRFPRKLPKNESQEFQEKLDEEIDKLRRNTQ